MEGKRLDSGKGTKSVEAGLLDVDYLQVDGRTTIRVIMRGEHGLYDLLDPDFRPYFCFVPRGSLSEGDIMGMMALDGARQIRPTGTEPIRRQVFGKAVDAFKVYVENPTDVPKMSSHMRRYGACYESDIPFARRYAVDMDLIPFATYMVDIEEGGDGRTYLRGTPRRCGEARLDFNVLCFDIETYNRRGTSEPALDPVLMLSYSYSSGKGGREGVITYKETGLPFAETVEDERALFARFARLVDELDVDIITGYNSTTFDVNYMLQRARALGIEFNLSRNWGETRIESHGLSNKVKIGGRVHVDMYQVVKFISVVGAAEHLLRLNSYTLKNVYEAISKDRKMMVEKGEIHRMWDDGGEELRTLAQYNLNDSHALREVYSTLVPITIELSRTTGNVISDTSVSTTGQLVEYMLMRYACLFGEMIPNRPTEAEMGTRLANPIEGAYVKTPEPGIYDDLAMFDFRGLYPSIIISHNIDPSAVCADCAEYYESPLGTRFDKRRKSITPTILQELIDQRKEVKKLYKRSPDDIFLGARNMALKILANSFFGYLGYARSRWYSRDCAGSITAYGRQYIKGTIEQAGEKGFEVIYGDTDSLLILLRGRPRSEAEAFLKEFNASLPGAMELELEDFYTRGVFVGKKVGKDVKGAKKKYALITGDGRIKIRGFELVRRDWSWIARDTQRRVLETILKEGSAEKAAGIVKEVIARLRTGEVPLKDLVIHTQLRKGIESYDNKSPELAAARKAVEAGQKRRSEVERSVIGYVITRQGGSISDKAVLEEFAEDYDADYYINHQVIPATMRILKELDFDEEELKAMGKQAKL